MRGIQKVIVIFGARQGSPPRMRGIRFVFVNFLPFHGITPAHAGNTFSEREFQSSARDHPRACGEYCLRSICQNMCPGSPPRMRGIPVMTFGDVYVEGITPAHAGNTLSILRRTRSTRDHPRACGEYQLPVPGHGCSSGITPAHAGNT